MSGENAELIKERMTWVRESLEATQGFDPEKRYTCPLKKTNVSATQCRVASMKPENNAICKRSNCPTIWRACDHCINEGTADFQESLIDKPTSLCAKHLELYKTRAKSGNDKSGESPEKEKKRGRHKKAFVLEDALARVMESASEPFDASVTQIRRFEQQPRLTFDKLSLRQLGESLQKAQIIPILVRKLSEEETKSDPNRAIYELVDGERRWKACQEVGKLIIKAICIEISDEATQFAISAMANFGRQDHTPLEEAFAIQYMEDKLNCPQAEIASHFAKSLAWVHLRKKLLRLDPSVQQMLMPDTKSDQKRPLSLSIAQLISDIASEHPRIQRLAADNFVKSKSVTSVDVAEKHLHNLMVKEGIELPERKKTKLQGPVHGSRVLDSLINLAWDKVSKLSELSSETFANMTRSHDERSAWKRNLQSLSEKLQDLAGKL